MNASFSLPDDLRARLDQLRRRHWIVSWATGLAGFVMAGCSVVLLQGWCDWWYGLSWPVRIALFVVELFSGAIFFGRFFIPRLRQKLTLTETALLVERRWPELQQRLVTAVEAAEGKPAAALGSAQLRERLLTEVAAQTKSLSFSEIVSLRRLRGWIMPGVFIALCTGAVIGVTWPSSRLLGERMVLLPVPRPPKTIMVAQTGDMTIAIGTDAVLRAKAQRVIPPVGHVIITSSDTTLPPYVLEVLPDKNQVFTLTVPRVPQTFRYCFQLGDAVGPAFTVTARPAPALTHLRFVEVFPPYTRRPPQEHASADLHLFAGSHLQIEAEATQSLQSATMILRGLPQTVVLTLDEKKKHLTADLPVPTKNLSGLSFPLVDEAGVASVQDTMYPVTLIPDKLPTVKWVPPIFKRQTVTLRARPVIAFEASDDYELAQLHMNFLLHLPMTDDGDATESRAMRIPFPIKPKAHGSRYDYTLDLSVRNPRWTEGMIVEYWIEAVDNNDVTGPGLTSSEHRFFRIVSLAEKEAELRWRLQLRAADLDELSDRQLENNRELSESLLTPKKENGPAPELTTPKP